MQTTSHSATCTEFEQATKEFEKRGWHVLLMTIGAIRLSTAPGKSKPQTSKVGVWHCSLA